MKITFYTIANMDEKVDDVKHITIEVDNSVFRIQEVGEGIAIFETTGRSIVVVPESTNAVAIVTT